MDKNGRTFLTSVLALLLAATTGIFAGVVVSASGPSPGSSAAPTLAFSHAVVVDEQRPGFEPDVKVDSTGQIYSSVPNGFSTTISYIWSSQDNGNSYHAVPGTVALGKPATCVGGGDSDLYVDSGNALYFSDLQGLTNISNSVSTNSGSSWSTNCDGAGANTPDDRMWFAATGSLAKGNLTLYQDFDQVDTALPSGGNQLVETVSHNGTSFSPVTNLSGLSSGCTGAAVDCVTDNEGISGNQVVDNQTGNVFIAHTTTNGNSAGSGAGVMIAEGKISQGATTSATWSESPNLDGSLCPNPTCVDKNGNAEELAGENFASIARDSAGYLYSAFTAGPVDHASSSDPNFGALTAPEQIYVVHSLEPATMSNPANVTWSKPQEISGSGIGAGTNTFPWIVAGSGGRVDVAWYHTNEASEKGTCASGSGTCTVYGADHLSNAEWTVQMGQSVNAGASSPTYQLANVSEAPVKHGQICTNGIGCTTGGDRSLGDFLQVTIDNQGAAVVSYVFDTSGNHQGGEDTGPDVISRQIGGRSLIAGDIVTQNGGPGLAEDSVTDPSGDAFYSANGSRTAASPNLDIVGASLSEGSESQETMVATIKVKSLSTLSASPSIGGPDASWMVRWTEVTPGKVGNGTIFYAGMDNNNGVGGTGKPSFFVGSTSCVPVSNPEEHCKYMTYPQTTAIQGSYDASTGVITLTFPQSYVQAPDGTKIFSVTALTATSATPQSSTTIFNLIDAATPFDHIVG